MKIAFHLFIVSAIVFFVGCISKNSKTEVQAETNKKTNKSITFDDFKKIKGVDNVQDVPFQLSTELDSIRFFVAPHGDSAYMQVAYNMLDNYYGFEEFDDFYSMHYSIENNIANSIEVFVLKTEFTAAFDLTLKGVKLSEIRSSTYQGTDDFENKLFDKYGTITEVSEKEFIDASRNRIDEVLVKNPSVNLKNNNWTYTDRGQEHIIDQYEKKAEEDGIFYIAYIGQSKLLGLEVFQESSDLGMESYYTFYEPTSAVRLNMYSLGYPQILATRGWISYVSSNTDVGSDFVINKYIPQEKGEENILYVNFTNFKVADDKKAFWIDNETFYAEVYPHNSAPAKGKKQRAAFIKIKLKREL